MKRIIQLILLGILSLFTNASAQLCASKWQAHQIVIDGDAADWVSLPRFYNSDSRVNYEFRNDDRNLYIILKTNDEAMQKQLMQAGFKLRFKLKTKQKITATILFPEKKDGMSPKKGDKGKKPDFNPGARPTERLADRSGMRERMMPKEIALLKGFIFSQDTIISNTETENKISFANKVSNQSSVYEFCIPLRDFFGDGYGMDNISTIPIQLQVNINGKSENSGTKSMRGGPGGGGMGGGPGGGGMGGGPGGDMSGGPGEGGAEMGGTPPNESEMPEAVSMKKKDFSIEFYLVASNK